MYKDKNLIYVSGEGYKEDDLQDMIEFYRQNYKYNLTLPKNWNADVTSQVLKNYPFYSRISKDQYNPQLNYEQYCDLDITFKEFIDYITEEQVNQFTFFVTEKSGKFNNYHFYNAIKFNYDDDNIYSYKLRDIVFYRSDIHISIKKSLNKNKLIKLLIDEYKDIDVSNVCYDINTVQNILNRRIQCLQYNNLYGKEMSNTYINNFFNDIPKNINSKFKFIQYCCYYLFLLYNLNLYDDALEFINVLDQNDGEFTDNVNELKEILEVYPIENLVNTLTNYL